MYFQKDYILRMIEMMGDLVRRICAIASENDARAELDEIAQRACGLPLKMLRDGDPQMLNNVLEDAQRFLAAELLMIALAVDARTKTDEELLPLRIQILALYASVREPDYALPAAERAATITGKYLAQLPVESLLSSAALFEYAGQLAPAEDAFYAAADQSQEAIGDLLSFYIRLDQLDDRVLLAGGLSRDEVTEARAALNRRLS